VAERERRRAAVAPRAPASARRIGFAAVSFAGVTVIVVGFGVDAAPSVTLLATLIGGTRRLFGN